MAKVIITVTCDWDALDYEYTNDKTGKTYVPPERFTNGVNAIKKFHEVLGDIPITHFICPAYFSRKSKHEGTYAQGMKDLAKLGDEIALHIHCWKSLVEACGVTFLDPDDNEEVPDWGRTHGSPLGLQVGSDYGHGVPLGAYSYGDIVTLMTESRALLCQKVGMKEENCVSFRSGGWMTSDSVFKAAEALKFKCEASVVNYKFFRNKWESTLDKWLATLWSGGGSDEFLSNRKFRIQYHSLPSRSASVLALQPRTVGFLAELPDTGVLADYVKVDWMKDHIDDAVELASTSKTDIYISFGCHLESGGDTRYGDSTFASKSFGGKKFGATGYIGRLVQALYAARETHGDKIAFQTIAQAGNKFLSFVF